MSKKHWGHAIAAACLILSQQAQAGIIALAPAKVVYYLSFSTWGDGDVVFTTETPVANCPGGFWLRGTDAARQQNMATLMTGKSTGQPVQLYIDDTIFWNGSTSTHYCYVYAIGLS